jgi:hypothetical protein
LDVKNVALGIRPSPVASFRTEEIEQDDECDKATRMFQKTFNEMGIDRSGGTSNRTDNLKVDTSEPDNLNFFYNGFIQAHWLMKSTNLRLDKNSEQQQIFCNQSWPRSLCNRDDINRFDNDYTSHTVTCLNPAEVFCDHPSCDEARCGKQGCLRCYRFLPRDYTLSANGTIIGRPSERSYDMITFIKCSWCYVSYCSNHIESGSLGQDWYQCEVCQKSSCPDCVSQVYNHIPDPMGCQVVSNGRICGRKMCKDCTWCVGIVYDGAVIAEKESMMTSNEKESMSNVEKCCQACQLQVLERMQEMQKMQNSFMGFMP